MAQVPGSPGAVPSSAFISQRDSAPVWIAHQTAERTAGTEMVLLLFNLQKVTSSDCQHWDFSKSEEHTLLYTQFLFL